MNVRAKFKVSSIKHVDWNPDVRVVELHAVTADGIPENERYHKYTPNGTIQITIDNPPAAEAFKLGNAYYVDFTPVD